MKIDKYMMATKAMHTLGDISRDVEDICCIHEEKDDCYIGSWISGYGFINVEFPKETTRELTSDEVKKYNGRNYQISNQPPFKLNIKNKEEK